MEHKTNHSNKRPPGPSTLGAVSAVVQAWRDPLNYARGLVEEYGDVVSYRIGPYSGYLVHHPDHFRHVLSDRHGRYGKNNLNYEQLKPVLGAGLITSEGEEWLRARRQLQAIFRRRRIDDFAPVIAQATHGMLERWDEAASRGESIDVSREMSILTLRVIAKVLFDLDIASDADRIASNFDIINENVARRFRSPFWIPRWVPTRRNRAFKRSLRDLETKVHKLIRACRDEQADNENLVAVLETAAAVSTQPKVGEEVFERRLRDHAVTLILAGYETTGALLAWTWFLLGVHPQWIDILRRELEEQVGADPVQFEHLSGLPRTRALIQEAMRLYPPVWVISRNATMEDEIGGYRVPVGTLVTLSAYLLHRHPSFWEKPDAFDPERFLRRPVERRHPFSYLPFGAGPRQCIGSRLAVIESMLVLAQVLRRYDPEVPLDAWSRPDPLVTLRPDMTLRATPRSR